MDLVRQVSSDMPQSFQVDSYLITSLIDALIKCGDVEGAEAWFNRSKSKHSSLYGAMMKGIELTSTWQRYSHLFLYIEVISKMV